MPRYSPTALGELIWCEKKPRWSPAKPGEPIESEMTTAMPGGLRKIPERPGGAGIQERTKKP